MALRQALVTTKQKKPSEFDQILLDSYSFRLRDLTKYYSAHSPHELKRVFEGNVRGDSSSSIGGPDDGAGESSSGPDEDSDTDSGSGSDSESEPKTNGNHDDLIVLS